MQEGDSSSLDQAPAFFDMMWLICVSDIPVKPTRLQSLSSHSSFWPYHSSEGRGSSIHGHFDEIKEREALTSVLICSIVEPWKCKLLAQKSEWIQDADQGKVNFFPVSSPVSQQILNADPKCWGEEMKWGGEKKQQQKKTKHWPSLWHCPKSLGGWCRNRWEQHLSQDTPEASRYRNKMNLWTHNTIWHKVTAPSEKFLCVLVLTNLTPWGSSSQPYGTFCQWETCCRSPEGDLKVINTWITH